MHFRRWTTCALPDVCVYLFYLFAKRAGIPFEFLHLYLKDFKVMLIKVLSHPSHGKCRCCDLGNWPFSFASHLRGLSVLANGRRVAGF